jgi:hypothetical protein
LLVAPVLATAVLMLHLFNGGAVKNSGVELAIGYRNNAGEFNYQVSVKRFL